jgi:hypothetical protein
MKAETYFDELGTHQLQGQWLHWATGTFRFERALRSVMRWRQKQENIMAYGAVPYGSE